MCIKIKIFKTFKIFDYAFKTWFLLIAKPLVKWGVLKTNLITVVHKLYNVEVFHWFFKLVKSFITM